MRQASFLPSLRLDHGGDLHKGRRKEARPFSHKNAIHVVFRSNRARGAWSLLVPRNERLVERLLERTSKAHHVRVYRFVNVGNHLHLLVKPEARQYLVAKRDFQRFLKQFGGLVAFLVTGARKTTPKGGFWQGRVYSRIVAWGRAYDRLKEYFIKNHFQARGLWWGINDPLFAPMVSSMRAAGLGPP